MRWHALTASSSAAPSPEAMSVQCIASFSLHPPADAQRFLHQRPSRANACRVMRSLAANSFDGERPTSMQPELRDTSEHSGRAPQRTRTVARTAEAPAPASIGKELVHDSHSSSAARCCRVNENVLRFPSRASGVSTTHDPDATRSHKIKPNSRPPSHAGTTSKRFESSFGLVLSPKLQWHVDTTADGSRLSKFARDSDA